MRGSNRLFAALLAGCLSCPAFAANRPGAGKAPEAVHFQTKLTGSPEVKAAPLGAVRGIPSLPSRPAGLGAFRAASEAPGSPPVSGDPGAGLSIFSPIAAAPLTGAEGRFTLEDAGDPLARRDELNEKFDRSASRAAGAVPVLRVSSHDGMPHLESVLPGEGDDSFPSDQRGNPLIVSENLKPLLPSSYNAAHWTGQVVLHLHSVYSDGTMTPSEVVQYAFDHGAKYVALTDHDTTAGVEEAAAKGRELGVVVIPAEELSAAGGTHIIALGLDIYQPELAAMNAKGRAMRYERARYFLDYLNGLDALKRKNIVLGMDDLLALTMHEKGGTIEISHVARLLVKKGLVRAEQEAYDTYLKGDIFARSGDFPDPSPAEVVKVGHLAGGLLSYAHPYTTRGKTPADQEANRLAVIQAGVDAIEAYRGFNPASDSAKRRADQRAAQFLTYADKHDLLVTAGADFHGLDTPLRTIVVPMPNSLAVQLMKRLNELLPAALAALRRGPGGTRAPPSGGTKLYSFAPIAAALAIPNRLKGSWSEVIRDASLLGIAVAWLWALKVLYASPFGKRHPLASALLSLLAALGAAAGWLSLMVVLQGWLK